MIKENSPTSCDCARLMVRLLYPEMSNMSKTRQLQVSSSLKWNKMNCFWIRTESLFWDVFLKRKGKVAWTKSIGGWFKCITYNTTSFPKSKYDELVASRYYQKRISHIPTKPDVINEKKKHRNIKKETRMFWRLKTHGYVVVRFEKKNPVDFFILPPLIGFRSRFDLDSHQRLHHGTHERCLNVYTTTFYTNVHMMNCLCEQQPLLSRKIPIFDFKIQGKKDNEVNFFTNITVLRNFDFLKKKRIM